MIRVDDIQQITTVVPRSIITKVLQIANKYGLGYSEEVPERERPRIKYFALEIWNAPDEVSITELVQEIKGDYEFAYGKDHLWFCTEAPTIRRKIKR